MCLTANSTRVCAGSICQIVGVSTWGAILAVIGVPPYGLNIWAGQSGPWCCRAQVRPQPDMSGEPALLWSVLLHCAVPLHSGPGRVLRQAWHVAAVCRTLVLSRALAPRRMGRTVSL